MEQSRSPRCTTLPWTVGDDLELDVVRLLDEFFHVHGAVAKALHRFQEAAWKLEMRVASLSTGRMPRPPPPAVALIMTG
jgi:hypothetical protein